MPGGNKEVTHTCLSMRDLLLPPGIKGLTYANIVKHQRNFFEYINTSIICAR